MTPFPEAKFGRVVNFASDSIFGVINVASYVLSKTALFGINKSFALEGTAHGIIVNCVGPTSYSRMIHTVFDDLTSERREGIKSSYTGESNIPMVLALSHESNTITGETFSVGAFQIARTIPAILPGPRNVYSLE